MISSAAATTVTVGGSMPHDVVIGVDVLHELPGLLGDGARRVLVVEDEGVDFVARRVAQILERAGLIVVRSRVPGGEAAKALGRAEALWSALGQHGFTRTDTVVSVGGGAVTDLAGFVAATWLRGVPVVHVPTTLLAMVDAAVGGKTAINTAEGKNLVGAFHSPVGVLADLTSLDTLPAAELASGMAEVVKAGFIADPQILDLIERTGDAVRDPQSPVLRELVERAVRVKAEVVAADPRERGGREVLNYGHTLGHAIEKVENFGWRHGAAISVGMVFAAELAAAVGRIGTDVVTRHRDLLEGLGLPTSYERPRWPELLEAMSLDKKARGSTLRFVVLDGIGRPGLLEAPDPDLLAEAYERVSR